MGMDDGDTIETAQVSLVTRLLSVVLFAPRVNGAGKGSGTTSLFWTTGPTDEVMVL